MKKTYILLLCLSFCLSLSAQEHQHQFCGTPDGRSEWLQNYQRRAQHDVRTEDTLWVPVQIHIVGTDGGSGYYNLTKTYKDFCELQEQFAPSNIQLYLGGPINYVNSSQLYYHSTFDEGREVMDTINYPDIVNVYISLEAAGNCGYAAYWSNTVVLAHSCIGPGSTTWAHEMGHVFSLPHTFDKNNLQPDANFLEIPPNDFERVDGSNCGEAGDGFCDTPPDYLGFRWTCNGDSLSSRVQVDPDGVEFRSEGQYFMSYADDACMSKFSGEQIGAMRAFIQEERPAYIANDVEFGAIEASVMENTIPEDGGYLVREVAQTLKWDKIEGADKYLVEITRFPNFSFIEFRGETAKNLFRINGNLIDGLTYYWRVRPINPWYLCHDYLGVQSFTAIEEATTTSVNELKQTIADIRVFPNPANERQALNIMFQAQQKRNIQVDMYSFVGKKAYSAAYSTHFGENKLTLTHLDLPKGVYYLSLNDGSNTWHQKIIIQ